MGLVTSHYGDAGESFGPGRQREGELVGRMKLNEKEKREGSLGRSKVHVLMCEG